MPHSDLIIRSANPADHPHIWSILKPIFHAGETYAIEQNITEKGALSYWAGPLNDVFVATDRRDGILGTYYLKPNGRGLADHICNCGYAVAAAAQGKGIARAMLEHSIVTASGLGFTAMQYNFVLETNARAIKTWERAGFETIGRIPKAYRHPTHGMIAARIMIRNL
ncbi:MAG: GNAT family N-acetyltransferase [Pseudomonadota bacterium]